jgi:hypothetical protein
MAIDLVRLSSTGASPGKVQSWTTENPATKQNREMKKGKRKAHPPFALHIPASAMKERRGIMASAQEKTTACEIVLYCENLLQ